MLTLKIRSRKFKVADFAEASRVYDEAWTAEMRKGGCIRGAEIYDASGEHIARVSQNGRIWSPEPWSPGQVPLYDRNGFYGDPQDLPTINGVPQLPQVQA